MINKKYYFLLLLIIYALFFIVNCNKKTTDFDRIKAVLKEISIYAEEMNYLEISKYISDNYKDYNNRNKVDVEKLMKEYMKRYRKISVSILEVRKISLDFSTAIIETDVFLSNGLSKIIRSIGLTGRYYKFQIKLIKNNSWKIISAKWNSISRDELSEKSLNLFKTIFG